MKQLIVFFTLLIIPGIAYSQTNQGTGLPLLDIAPSASFLAHSEASAARAGGAASLYINPAMLSLSRSSTLDLSYTNWIGDSNNIFGGINLVKGRRAFAFSFYTSGITGLEQRDNPGPSNGDFSIQYLAVTAGYSYDFDLFSLGVSGHYLNEEVFPFRARGFAVNAGIGRTFMDDRFIVGASVSNMGEMENLDLQPTQLPSKLTIGFSGTLFEYRHRKNLTLPIVVGVLADYVVPFNQTSRRLNDFNANQAYANVGLTLLVAETIEINGGYKSGDNARPVSFGIGFVTENITFNYANIPFNTGFGTVHSIGIQYQL